ncbi:MAG: alanyl-tRNA editing protein [Hungatella sp.]|nr:alanyl-tRNA editing protein [Hungatella sp.]
MEKLYEKKPDVREFDAVVLSCSRVSDKICHVTLDRSAFYPEGGGQPYDTGMLGQARVTKVHEKDGQVLHHTDRELEPGLKVRGVIDWERRQCHMQHHTGEHIFSGLVHSRYGYDNVGFHMGQDMVTIDFNGMLTADQVRELEEEANRLVWADVPVESWYPSEEELHRLDYRSKKELSGPVRIVRVPGGDTCACCGTHVSHTGQIGMIKITGLKKYKGGVRLDMVCGLRALDDYEKKQEEVIRISNLLSARQGEVSAAVEKLMGESEAQKVRMNRLYEQIFKMRCQQLPSGREPLLIFEEELPPARLRQLCNQLCQEGKGEPVLVCSGGGGQFYYVLGSGEEKVDTIVRTLNGLLFGKGSGKGLMAQGMFAASKEEICRVWDDRLWKE